MTESNPDETIANPDDAERGFAGRPDYRVVHLGRPKAVDYDRDFHDSNLTTRRHAR